MTQIHHHRINRNGHVMQLNDRDYGFIFSENIEDWIHSKVRTNNKRIVAWQKMDREKRKAKAE